MNQHAKNGVTTQKHGVRSRIKNIADELSTVGWDDVRNPNITLSNSSLERHVGNCLRWPQVGINGITLLLDTPSFRVSLESQIMENADQ